MKRIYDKPITEKSPIEPIQILDHSRGSGPNGGDGLLPSFGGTEVILVERGDNTRTELWEDPDDSDRSSGPWK